ncbi:hypothetical protein GCM10027275_32800 [Rhabdobacter roseus]|uniref:Uncharacterized protein n=1 Tax=Rhabdobacter roseus TaxID=1655419 RepID=A0A840TZ82_9BACT|nr:hypothetical protein [Rhabdobacter roseus]MBB5285498.1 hypothetical protein [Rhabdobacter roseus]
MLNKIVALALLVLGTSGTLRSNPYKDDYIQYEAIQLTAAEKQLLRESLDKLHDRYDPKEKMLTKTLTGWNYHTDAESGVFHEVRASFGYAVALLDLGEKQYEQRAFDIIRKTISLQDTISTNKTAGIWPYYLEEPLATKKSPADWNWADFNGVSLLDIYMGHQEKLPEDLKAIIRTSLIYAARSIQKRDVQPGYTNIAIMGTYVTYMTSHLFDLPAMKVYAKNRLDHFYEYTLKRGFTEYNSPTYTVVALDELDRMKRHIVEKDSKQKIESLYTTAWEVIAKHYHKPSGQWAGPHSRAYSSLLMPTVNGIFKQASNGRIDLPGATPRNDVKIKHQIPEHLMPYFLAPKYPRTQQDVLSIDDPKIIGTTYLTDQYALSSANRSSLWNQRRPFLAYWGTPAQPHYLQVRLLHDLYDFSAASFYSEQKENNILAAITFLTNGGDKHISIDKLQNGKFKAKDLRLRFEFGNIAADQLKVPSSENAALTLTLNGLQFDLQLYHAVFGPLKGHWEKGGDEKAAWIDYVLYAGQETELDLTTLEEAALGFTFSLKGAGEKAKSEAPAVSKQGEDLEARWKGLHVRVPTKPMIQPKNL